ncbi:MAG: stage II sporulation protein P [Erysipelotrichaceae bacterium]|nr:stage II sporulation protein P [Erysipelotrichaceae bacterium]
MAHKHMNLKNTKKRKRFLKIKFIFYILLIYVGFSYTFYYSLKTNKTVSNEEFINLLVSTGNANILSSYKATNLVNATMKFILNIDFTKPVTLLNGSILEYGKQKSEQEVETISLEYNDDYSNMEELKEISDYIEDPNPTNTESPLIYLYNTHQLENYSGENLNIYGITPNVLMASYVLRENLNKLGLPTIVEEANMSEILSKNGWNYAYSYQASRSLMEEKKNKYSTLTYYIDIHRDSVSGDYTTVTIGDKKYAKVLFVIGMEHANWQANYNFATNLNLLLEKYYSGLSRGIMQKQGMNVNGIYNQDLSPNCLLIEVGGVDNTIEEVYNTMNALADVLFKQIKGE